MVYVLAKDGEPLQPTCRHGHVRKLLDSGKARVVQAKPFTIQLLYESTKFVQKNVGGTDPGRTNIGNAVLDERGQAIYADWVESANKDVKQHLDERRTHRQASRRGERLARKRLAKRNGTTKDFGDGRKLPQCEEKLAVKDIRNTEARYCNRKRPNGWITPAVRHLVETHLNMVKKIRKFLPVSDWVLEMNKFAFMLMEDGSVRGVDFQNGRMKGFPSVESYVDAQQNGVCMLCGEAGIEHHHHIVPRSKGGSDLPENIVGLCQHCHSEIHRGNQRVLAKLKAIGQKKKYGALSVLNQAIPRIYDGLVEIFGEEHVHICNGWETKERREDLGLEKTHAVDASVIASFGLEDVELHPETVLVPHKIKQFRRHNRALIHSQRERTYKLDGKAVAKNRKPRFEQVGDSLLDWKTKMREEHGGKEARCMESKLTVFRSKRLMYSASPRERLMKGAVFLHCPTNKVLIYNGSQNNEAYLLAFGHGRERFKAMDCKFLAGNVGLKYL